MLRVTQLAEKRHNEKLAAEVSAVSEAAQSAAEAAASAHNRDHNNAGKGGLGIVYRTGNRGHRPCKRGRRRRHNFHPTQKVVHHIEIESTEKGQGLQIGHRPNHVNGR